MNQVERRLCQPCTACCDGWVRMTIKGHAVYPGCACPHSTGASCNDYANRPQDPCVRFHCGWILPDSPLPDWMRPDRCGAIVLFAHYRWQGTPVDQAVPVGERIPAETLDWLKGFATQHRRPLIYSEHVLDAEGYTGRQEYVAFGPPAFQDWVKQQADAGNLAQ